MVSTLSAERENVALQQSATLYGDAFAAELGPESGLTSEQVASAWMEIEHWLDSEGHVPRLVWLTRFCTSLGLELSSPSREEIIGTVGRFPATVVEAVARSLDPTRWEQTDDPVYEGTPMDERLRSVQPSLRQARTALAALETTGCLGESTISRNRVQQSIIKANAAFDRARGAYATSRPDFDPKRATQAWTDAITSELSLTHPRVQVENAFSEVSAVAEAWSERGLAYDEQPVVLQAMAEALIAELDLDVSPE
ncbi:hypothetical protein LG293_15900 (plasmid) [Citricoccus nitrophenolicus]